MALKENSHIKVECVCVAKLTDKCIETSYTEYREYIRKVKKYGTFLCKHCARYAKNVPILTRSDISSVVCNDHIKGQYSPNSHSIISCVCDFQTSHKCLKIAIREYRDFHKNISANNGKYMCFYCSCDLKRDGDANPNKKYDYSAINFEKYDNDSRVAYFLGWLASDGTISQHSGTIALNIHEKDSEILEHFASTFNLPPQSIKPRKSNTITLSIHDKIKARTIRDILQLPNDNLSSKKSHLIHFPKFTNNECQSRFIQGFFEGDGHIRNIDKRKYLECCIACTCLSFCQELNDVIEYKGRIDSRGISWGSDSAINFLEMIYREKTFALSRKYDMFTRWKNTKRYEHTNI